MNDYLILFLIEVTGTLTAIVIAIAIFETVDRIATKRKEKIAAKKRKQRQMEELLTKESNGRL
jgi:hypothetical protein